MARQQQAQPADIAAEGIAANPASCGTFLLIGHSITLLSTSSPASTPRRPSPPRFACSLVAVLLPMLLQQQAFATLARLI